MGIAIALASGATGETCWNNRTVAGTSASVTATCTRAAILSAPMLTACTGCGGRPCTTQTMAATAPKDNQNPAEITAATIAAV
jgi:hypothetical protein